MDPDIGLNLLVQQSSYHPLHFLSWELSIFKVNIWFLQREINIALRIFYSLLTGLDQRGSSNGVLFIITIIISVFCVVNMFVPNC